MKEKTVPELRFEGFFQAWEQRKLGDHAEILTGGTPKTSISEYWNPKQIPWMSSGEVNKKRLDGTDNMISEKGLKNSSARWIKEHSVLIALTGKGKTRGTVAVNNIRLTTNQSTAAIIPNDNLYYEFIYQNLIKRYDELRMISSGDRTRGGLNNQIISDVVIPCPSKDEQIKIGTFFKRLDDTIAIHQRKLEQLRLLKQGFLQKMFVTHGRFPEVRFAKFDEEWERRKLHEMLSEPITDGPHKTPKLEERGVPFISVEAIVDNKIDFNRKHGYISVMTDKLYSKKYKPQYNNVFLVKSGSTVGKVAIVETKKHFNIWSPLAAMRVGGVSAPYFLYYLLQTKGVQKQVRDKASNGSQPNLGMRELENFFVKITLNLDEQKKIGIFFKQLDDTISLHHHKLNSLKQLKKSFLQKMFI
ncbi:restriction endonuclease subunit S [Enterococcus villorum]|uniref:restriction endonuclease subunit S n=1 Tax=Enterococcus villorum TaxID=112904 RepID=UPI0009C12E82|nr:restriction endonuclease subunit S [Enterococcus villorum]OQO72861.1 hypothetical protein BH744_10940 [Enterococcus villorum]